MINILNEFITLFSQENYENIIKILIFYFKNQNINISFLEADSLFIYAIIISLLLIIYNLIYYYQIISLVFSIGLLFFFSGLYFAYLGGEFIGLTLILVYVGAILVLFLYFIMILEFRYLNSTQNYYKHILSLFIIAALLVFLLNNVIIFINSENAINITNNLLINNLTINTLNLKNLGYTLYGIRFIDIVIIGFILLVGVYGIITIIVKKTENRKTQDILRQILNKKKY